MKLICISDTHSRHWDLSLPEGDVLIHAGDFTRQGRAEEIEDFNRWLETQSHPHKIVIAGNHDFLFEQEPERARELLSHAHYLEDSGIEIQGIKFWGSPVSPRFFNWAFNRDRGDEIAQHWQQVPRDTQVLITHTPPFGCLDRVWFKRQVGCEALRSALEDDLKPLALICGHIHEDSGHQQLGTTHVINSATLDRRYRPIQPIWELNVDVAAGKIEQVIPHLQKD